MSNSNPMEGLENIRDEGNQLFAKKNWSAAVIRYSQCINQAVDQRDDKRASDNSLHSITMKENLNRFLLLVYSNRAEARLRLRDYQNALIDSDRALKISPQHVKSLFRKGKAAHGLHLFETACRAFKAANEQWPEEQSILENLQASTIAFKQSRRTPSGTYDLSEFFLMGCRGEVPSCDDFVGPVNCALSDRALRATRNVRAGELLLVSNALAVVVKDAYWEKNLIAQVTDRIRTSKCKMAQLYSLDSYGIDIKEIKDERLLMELFRSESEEVPSGVEKLEVEIDRISGIVKSRASLCRDDHTLWAKTCDENEREFVGLWVLLGFVSHSCAPNVFLIWIGDALFFRASVDIKEGRSLTISYLQEKYLFNLGAPFRHDKISSSLFSGNFWSCYCDRCCLEKSLQAPVATLARIRKVIPNLLTAAKAESHQRGQERRATKKLADVADKVELEVIQSHDELGPEQRGWIRVHFLDAYIAKLQLAMDESDSQSRIELLSLVVDSITSVRLTPRALKLAANLLWEVKKMYTKNSQSYVLTYDRVLGIYRVAFGNEPISILHKLITVNLLKDVKDFLLDYNAG